MSSNWVCGCGPVPSFIKEITHFELLLSFAFAIHLFKEILTMGSKDTLIAETIFGGKKSYINLSERDQNIGSTPNKSFEYSYSKYS